MSNGPLFDWGSDRKASGVFSECTEHEDCADPYCKGRHYRYLLRWPTDVSNDRVVAFILANPSIATPLKLDPTLVRCASFAADWGFGWMYVANARAWRETKTQKVPADPIAIGPENDRWIVSAVASADLVVCGWGKLGGARGERVLELIRRSGKVPHALKLNADGSPQHPLYLRGDLRPFPMEVQ